MVQQKRKNPQTQLFQVQFTKPYNPEKLISFFKDRPIQISENAMPNYFTGGDYSQSDYRKEWNKNLCLYSRHH